LLHLQHLIGDLPILGIGVLGGLDDELQAPGVGTDDA
jgi:hypothetical protein